MFPVRTLNQQILLRLAVVGTIACLAFALIIYEVFKIKAEEDVHSMSQDLISRAAQMFVVSTVRFNQEYTTAESGERKAEILADWKRTIRAVDKAVTHDFGGDVARLRLFSDGKGLPVAPLGGVDTGVETGFERSALGEFAAGEASVTRVDGDYFEMAVPLTSDMHPGCANCHGVEVGRKYLLGGLGVKVPVSEVYQQAWNSTLFLVGLSVLALAVVMGLVYSYLFRNVSRPLSRLTTQTQSLADCLADGAMKHQRIDAKGRFELGMLAKSIAGLQHVLQRVLGEMTHNARAVGESAENTAVIAEQTKSGMIHRQGQLEAVSASLSELKSAGTDVSSRAVQTADATRSVATAVEQGRETVVQTTAAIEALSSSLGNANEVIQQLDKRSENIGSIVSTIDAIAEQTNLLALNAAIEAARAGEQGKGFAVVAEEVRHLAQRTQEATREINQLVVDLQTDARHASGVMATSTEQAGVTVGHADAAAQALAHITEEVDVINDMNTQIASAAEQQAATLVDVSGHLDLVSEDTRSMLEGAEKTVSESQQLSDLSSQLSELIKVED